MADLNFKYVSSMQSLILLDINYWLSYNFVEFILQIIWVFTVRMIEVKHKR